MDDNINILNELKNADATTLMIAERQNYYHVPEEYFNSLPADILSNIFIKSLPSLTPFQIPPDYFKNFSENLLEKIRVRNIAPFLDTNKFSERIPYHLPEGYFESFAENLLKKINEKNNLSEVNQELEELAPLLSKIPKTNLYSVPEGYFYSLSPLQKGEKNEAAGKLIPFKSKPSRWISYAAAACIAILFLGGGGYWYVNNNTSQQSINQPIAKVDIKKGISELSDVEIESYLNTENNSAIYTNQNPNDQQYLDINNLLENTSDEEIQHYLIENADPGEVKKGI